MESIDGQQNFNANTALISGARRGFVILFLASFFVQVTILADWENVICAALAVATSIATFSYTFRMNRFTRWPFSMIMLLGYNLGTLAGTILVQTFGWRPLTFNLEVPVDTFALMAAVQFLAIGCHAIYARSAEMRVMRHRICKFYDSWSLFKAPSNYQLWFLGALGCLASWFTAVGQYGNTHFGEIGFKFLNGFTPFVVAPFLIPIGVYLFENSGRRRPINWLMLSLYFVLICFTAIGRNSRAAFAVSILVLLIAVCLAVLLGNLVVKRRHVIIAGICLMPCWIVASALADFATAMVMVRGLRGDVPPKKLIAQTLVAFQNKDSLKKFREYETLVTTGYNEVYIDNIFLSRFIYTKYIDLNLALAEQVDERGIAEARNQFVEKLLAELPTPIMNMIDPNLNKQDLQYSSGDFYNNLARGDSRGGYRTGSVLADGLVVLGWFYIPFLAAILFFKYILYDALSMILRDGKIILSPMGVLFVFPIFTYGVMDENLAGQIGGILRGVPQAILLYLLAFHVSRIFSLAHLKRSESRLDEIPHALDDR